MRRPSNSGETPRPLSSVRGVQSEARPEISREAQDQGSERWDAASKKTRAM